MIFLKKESKMICYIYGVAEHWINLRFVLYKIKKLDNPSDNADMSNEKEKIARLKLMEFNKIYGL
jgi:hypothetical protein